MHRKVLTYRPIDPQIAEVVDQHDRDPEAVVDILRELQGARAGLVEEDIQDLARALNLPAEKVAGVASFYSMLQTPQPARTIRVCDSPVCWLKGGAKVLAAAKEQLGEDWVVERNSCLGLCDRAPAALVSDQQCGPLDEEAVPRLAQGWLGEGLSYAEPRAGETRVLLADLGEVDPHSLDSALAHGAYQGLAAAFGRKPEDIVAEVEASGLLGRGGAGFPTGRKWGFVAQAGGDEKYIVCNADESEPLAFKDRVLIESKPHQLLEGIALAAYAVGAHEGFIYIRGEYPAQAELLAEAIKQAEAYNWLGEDIQGSGFSFHLHVHCGAGAYICGEETALLESLEGKRGEPRLRPPYPVSHGYHGKPTVVNNVETLSNVPAIVRQGADWYRSLSEAKVPGTKLYAVLGHVNRPGLFEASFGLTLRQIIEDFGGGMRPGSELKFVLAGGAAGYLVPPDLLDVPIYYDSWKDGLALGVGAYLVCDQTISPLAFLREVMHFFESESCGKCTPCRQGTRRVREILDEMLAGEFRPSQVQELRELAALMKSASFCGLGVSAAWPIESMFAHFEDYLTGPKTA